MFGLFERNGQLDARRLRLEAVEIKRSRALRHFELYEDTDYEPTDWRRYLWKGRAPTGHEITARYPENYPHRDLSVHVTPDVRTHHKWRDGRLCLMEGHEWSPDFTAATNIAIAFRFLQEHNEGRTG